MLAIVAALLWIFTVMDVSAPVMTTVLLLVGFGTWLLFQEMRLSRSELEASHERFEAVAKATNDLIWDWDPRTDRVWRSDAVKTLLGYGDDHDPGSLDWLRYVAPTDHARVEASFRQALASGVTTWSSEYQLRRADGSMACILDRAIIVRDSQGRPIRMVGAMTDLTAQRRAEEGHARLAAILEASPDFVGTADAVTLRVTWINRAGRRMAGLTDDEDISHLFVQDFQPPWVLDSLLDEIISVAVAGGVWTGESGLLPRNGEEIPVLKTVVAHKGSDGKAAFISTVARDLRDRKQLEAQLLQAQKMESIGRLAGGVAHDFNNMLTAIIGYTELAKAQLPPEHPAQDDLTNVNDAARRSAGLTRQLLAFARKQIISPRPVDLNELIGRLETMLNRLLGEDIRLITRTDPELFPVLIDSGQFEQVLMNLAVNARDAMVEGGTLRIETVNASLDEAWCHQHPGSTPGEYGLVRVSDTGVGMPPEVMAHIFEPFFTTKVSGEGTGLGLAMCYGIVKQNGGTIWVSSEPGRGTTFDIYLPRYSGDTTPAHEARKPMAVDDSAHETILLVEDETFVRELAYRTLSDRGYRILTAADGPAAIDIARTHEGAIDLVLSDVVMPHMGVAELATRLREYRPNVRLMFMSGYNEAAVHRHGVVAAGAGLIEKPFTPEALSQRVKDALHGRLTIAD
jgi:two-component system cell cycle sensor histidine kinase/response regulator CckA